MPIFDLYSKRKKLARAAGTTDVYSYDKLPNALRVQIVHIWRDALGKHRPYENGFEQRWEIIHDAIAREKGVFELASYGSHAEQCMKWFLEAKDTDDALDMIELSFRVISRLVGPMEEYTRSTQGIVVSAEDAISELNQRFREHGVGYQFENEEIVRVDSQYVHAEITKPALTLLSLPKFESANAEFMSAHRHYRSGEYKDSIVACQRAFESTLKAICTQKKWKFASGDRLPELLKIARAKGLFPDYLDNGFDTYVAMLKTGLPGLRNNAGGHGAAPDAAAVTDYIAAYALHMTATNILLAMEAFRRN